MCAVTKVANASGLVTATLSQLAQTISVVKNNHTKRKGAKVTILTYIKKKQKEAKDKTTTTTNKNQKNWLKVVKLK